MPIEFESRTFTLNSPGEEELKDFKNDAELFRKIEREKLNDIIKSVKEIILAKTRRGELEIYNRMVTSGLVSNRQTALVSHRLIRYFLKVFTEDSTKEDSSKEITKDLATLGFDSKTISSIENLLSLLKKEAKWYKNNILKESFYKGLFPYLKGVGTTVELRGVFNQEITYGETVDEYAKEAKIEDKNATVPIVSVAITLDSGTPDRFCFQASPELIEWLIEELKASLHKIRLLENYGKNAS